MESITGLRELRGAPPGLAGQPPCLVWHCLSHPLSPQAYSSRTWAEWVCIYYFLFSFTLASVFLSTEWSIDSLTGLRELRGAPPGLAGQSPWRVWHCLSHTLRSQAQLSRRGAERVCIYFFHQWVSDVLNCPLGLA